MSDLLDRIAHHNCGKTHWEGCEDDHLLCAASKEIERLEAENKKLRVLVERGIERLKGFEECEAEWLRADLNALKEDEK